MQSLYPSLFKSANLVVSGNENVVEVSLKIVSLNSFQPITVELIFSPAELDSEPTPLIRTLS